DAFKGCRQLVYSDGLRKLLRLEAEKTDAEIAAETPRESVLQGAVDYESFRLVQDDDLEAELLEVSESEGWPGVQRFLEEVCGSMKAGHVSSVFLMICIGRCGSGIRSR